jgi:hypothetical protein
LYIESECSKHLAGNQKKFITLKEEKGGNVTFGDNAYARIFGKGIVSLDDGKTKTQNVLYVEGLKHNLLSISQMCDQGYKLTFHSKGCDIMKACLGILVANANRTPSNVYVLNEVKGEKYVWDKQTKVGSDIHLISSVKENTSSREATHFH